MKTNHSINEEMSNSQSDANLITLELDTQLLNIANETNNAMLKNEILETLLKSLLDKICKLGVTGKESAHDLLWLAKDYLENPISSEEELYTDNIIFEEDEN